MTHGLYILGRLKPKVSLEQPQAETVRLVLELRQLYSKVDPMVTSRYE
jgi:hypothetical protein